MSRKLLVTFGLAAGLSFPALSWAQETAAGTETTGILAREPKTPQETFDAALTMLKLSRPELARQYLAALLSANPDDAILLAIREKHGTATFVQLARQEVLQPESTNLLDLLNSAARNQLADPDFRASLVNGLKGSVRERESSMDILRALDDEGPPLLIGRLAAGAPADEEVLLMEALLRFGSRAIGPLEAALDSSSDRLRTLAADLLGRLSAESATLPLSVAAFAADSPPALSEAARRALARIQFDDPDRAGQVSSLRLAERLKHQAAEHLAQAAELPVDEAGTVPVWSWSQTAGTVQLSAVSSASAFEYRGERLARMALKLAPEDREAQRLLLAHLMWRDVQRAGWDQPLPVGPGTAHDLALAMSPELNFEVLHTALDRDNPAAALVALNVLASSGSRSQVLAAKSPVLESLNAPEPRLQFAAAETIMQLDPQTSFPGAARVVEVFARALMATSQPKTVVIDPNVERGAAIADLISGMGFDSGVAATGQQGFEIAASQGNIELAVLHLNTVQWELTQTIANLRADPRTRRIPIAVYGPPALHSATARKLKPYQLVSYLDDAGDPGLLRDQLSPLIASRQVPELTEDQRRAQMESAAYWLRHMAEGQRSEIFPLAAAEAALSEVAGQTGLAGDALIALGAIGKPSVQQRMAEVALSSSASVETQQAAIVQLAFHMQRYGRMLDAETTRQVADAYRQAQDPQLQGAWSAVIGALGGNPQAAGSQLLAFPPLDAPLP